MVQGKPVRQRPRPPLRPPPQTDGAGNARVRSPLGACESVRTNRKVYDATSVGGSRSAGSSLKTAAPGSNKNAVFGGMGAVEKVVVAVALAIFASSSFALFIYVNSWISAERPADFLGITLERRMQLVKRLPTSDIDLVRSREARSGALTLLNFPGQSSAVQVLRLQAPSDRQGAVSRNSPPSLFHDTLIFGIPAESSDSGASPEEADLAGLEADVAELEPPPSKVAACEFENTHQSSLWRAKGLCLIYPSSIAFESMERKLKLLALKHGEPALFRWWPHIWGKDRQKHHTMMQTIVPVLPSLSLLKSNHPVYLV